MVGKADDVAAEERRRYARRVPETYIEPLTGGRYEFGVVLRDARGEQRIKKGVALRIEDADQLLAHIDDVLDEHGR